MEGQPIRCAHILQKHTQSRNPNDSYRKKPVTRSPQEAQQNINSFRTQIEQSQNPADEFALIASQYSECMSAGKNGDLGFFEKGQMQKSFEDSAYSLQVGEISGPVVSDSGIHLILRIQ